MNFPVIVVDQDGRILDGRHRLKAAERLGIDLAAVRDGIRRVRVADPAEALAIAWVANEGRPWTKPDRERIAKLMTASDGSTTAIAKIVSNNGKRALIEARLREHPDWADNRIANALGCSDWMQR